MDVYSSPAAAGPAAASVMAAATSSFFLHRATKSLVDVTQLLLLEHRNSNASPIKSSSSAASTAGVAFVAPYMHARSRSHSCLLFESVSSSSLSSSSSSSTLRKSIRATLGTTQPAPFPEIIGHRGALYEALENTLESFEYCAQLGCHGVELDVFWLGGKDDHDIAAAAAADPSSSSSSLDHLICFHGGGDDDASPGDLTNYCLGQAGKSILDISLEQALSLEFDPSQPEFACSTKSIQQAKIPTLKQVLCLLKDTSTNITIELKGPNTVQPCILLVEELHMQDRIVFSSFDHMKLTEIHNLRPNVFTTAALFDDIPVGGTDEMIRLAQDCHANQIHLRYDTCTVDRIAHIHASDLGSMAWLKGPVGMAMDSQQVYMDMGNEDASCYRAILETGVQRICCNRPNVLKQVLVDDGRYKI